MVYKARWSILLALAGVIAASAFITDAVYRQLWASIAFGLLGLAGCLVFLVRLQLPVIPDPPAGGQPVSAGRGGGIPLADDVPMPLLEFHEAKGLVAVNRAARTLFQTDDLIAQPPESLMDVVRRRELGPARPVKVLGRMYALGISEIMTPDATVRLISLTDIQSEVRVAEATALRDLLRVLSHEIMNSLTPVASLARIAHDYLANETTEASKAAREALDVLAQRADGLARFVEAYRSMARLPEPAVRRTEMGTLLADIIRVFERSVPASEIDIEIALPADCPTLEVDETLLTQALLNLLKNAAEATEGGTGRRRVRLSLEHNREETRICVADNGGGVPDDLAEQIFHAFVTTKPEGSGTGLNLARQIALAHGGDLVFMGRSEGWSSVFCFIVYSSPRVLGAD
jgi:signal transduction histidine kinase